MKPWGVQVDELVDAGMYAEALALLNSIDAAVLPDKVCTVALAQLLTDSPTSGGATHEPGKITRRSITIPCRGI